MPSKSFAPKPVNVINFGKYKGKTMEEVYETDPAYLAWMRDTTDPADAKNEGKYAKQNQARIKYITDLLSEGRATTVATPLPKKTPTPTMPVPATMFERILQVMLKIEEKVDAIMKATKANIIVTPSQMEPDEDTPFDDNPDVI